MTGTPVPPFIEEVLSGHPTPIRGRLLAIRELIFFAAAGIPEVGLLIETLKWGEPAYLVAESRRGTTIRLGRVGSAPSDAAVLFNCKTTLIQTFRAQFPDGFNFDGNRGLMVPCGRPFPRNELLYCLSTAWTYHRKKVPVRTS